MNTSIGSSINGSNKFYGFIRDFRYYTIVRSDTQIAQYRYSSVIWGSGLLYYFRLNTGIS